MPNSNIDNLRVKPADGGYGWIIVIACTVINSSLPPLMQCFGIIYTNQFSEMGIKAAEISFLLHLNSSIMCGLGLLSGPMLKRYNYRQTSLCGCALVCSGVIITSFMKTYGQLIFPVCILIGAGQSFLMPSTSMAINSYFEKRLTLAMSFTITGVAVFPIIIPHICNFLLNVYGTTGTILILGAISLHSFAGALLLRPLKIAKATSMKDESKKLLRQHHLPNANDSPTSGNTPQDCKILGKLLDTFDFELFKNRAYVIIIIGIGISYVAELNFTLMTPFVLSEMASFTRAEVALAMSIQASADIIGRLCIPLIAHKTGWSPKLMYACSLGAFSIGRTVMASFCNIKSVILASCAFIGLAKGAKAVFQALILPKFIPFEKLASAMGFLMVLNGILSLIVGPLIGAVHDLTNSYTDTLHCATCLSMVCIILWVLDYFARTCRPKARVAGIPSNVKGI